MMTQWTVFPGRTLALGARIGMLAALSLLLVVVQPPWAFRFPFVHGSLEAFGAFLACIVAWHSLTSYLINPSESFRVWIGFAFLSMGVFDAFGSVVGPGESAVWFHSCSAFIGGLFALLVWIPEGKRKISVKAGLILGALIFPVFGTHFVWFPETIPLMVDQGEFTLLAKVLNGAGGLAFLGVAGWFFQRASSSREKEWIWEASCYVAIGLSEILFIWSTLWSPLWWWWHGIRFVAYGVIAYGAKLDFEHGLVRTAVTAARADENERFRLVVESAPCGMLMVGPNGVISMANSKVEQLFRYPRHELIGHFVEILLPLRYRGGHPGAWQMHVPLSATQGTGPGQELYGCRKDGSEFPVEIGLTSMRGSMEGSILATIVDISERKQTQDELAKQAMELGRSNRELEQFAYAASHDLQEPLRMVSSYCDLLARRYKGRLDQDADDFIGFAVDGARRMKSLIDALLLYSRVGLRQQPYRPVDMNESLRGALANLELSIQEAGASVTSDSLPVVLGDGTQLMQVFQNLIGNAIKFRGERPPVIHVSAQCSVRSDQAGEWEVSIRDNGIGIDQDFRERIFVIFQRFHTRAEYPGNGIGLAITKKIVERHGGRIWVESPSEGGSIFHFTVMAPDSARKPASGTVIECAA